MDTQTVKVSDITEYNPNLGTRCFLLRELGLNPYINTEEEICAALESSAHNEKCLKLCMTNSHCGAFWEAYSRNETPFIEKDPIRLTECNGKYWVAEGKHRVCMAKRFGIEAIQARVDHFDEDYLSLLPEAGKPGRFIFTANYGHREASGEVAVLWVVPPRDTKMSRFNYGPVPLNPPNLDHAGAEQLFSGVSYETTVRRKRLGLRNLYTITAEVVIEQPYPATRIWLYTVPARGAIVPTEVNTVFRCGLWRNMHTYRTCSFSPELWPWKKR